MAQASPYFLGGCSQFIVEYAGDFLTQDNNPSHTSPTSGGGGTHTQIGDITAYASDGQLDFTMVNGVKQIKWYGMPRNTSGLSGIKAANGDVVPLRDWLRLAVASTGSANPLPCASFEQPQTSTGSGYLTYPPYLTDYSNGALTPAQANAGYTCAFGPNDIAPKLIRISITLDDPTGRLPDGLTYQYVFSVPSP